jgi:hypothetical protein
LKTFVDNAGRTWTIAINVGAIKRVRGLLNINLLEILEGELIDRLIRDPVLLCDVVYAVCKPEADALNVTDEEFGQAMAGDAIEQATKALLDELVLFSPSRQARANLQRVLDTTWRLMDRAQAVIAAKLDSGEMEKTVEHLLTNGQMPETQNDSSGNSPELSASSPNP